MDLKFFSGSKNINLPSGKQVDINGISSVGKTSSGKSPTCEVFGTEGAIPSIYSGQDCKTLRKSPGLFMLESGVAVNPNQIKDMAPDIKEFGGPNYAIFKNAHAPKTPVSYDNYEALKTHNY